MEISASRASGKKKSYLRVIKKIEKNLDVANGLSHTYVNFKYFYILSYTRMIKVYLNMHIFKSLNFIRFFYFYVAHNTNSFVLRFSMLVEYIFFKKNRTCKYEFYIIFK